jgi:hypothetical protein
LGVAEIARDGKAFQNRNMLGRRPESNSGVR